MGFSFPYIERKLHFEHSKMATTITNKWETQALIKDLNLPGRDDMYWEH